MKPKLLTTWPETTSSLFLSDALAGVTVAMVALPLSIAIAIASGAPPSAGIVTAIIGGFLISALGGSRVQIGGPTGAFIVVVYGVIQQHGYDGLLLATLMAGLILIAAAIVRAGRLIALIPEAVIEGFTIGIAIIIATSQLKDLLGLTVQNVPADFVPKVQALWGARESFSMAALVTGVAAAALIVILRRVAPRLPGLIVATALVSAAVILLALPVDTVASRYGALAAALPMPSLPPVSLERIAVLLPSALVIAFLAGVESLLSAIVADRMIGGAHRSNAELMAQGAANLGSALFGGLPATGAIARTATNVRAGGRTPVAGMIHALVILIVMLLAAPLAGHLALPALAGLLLVTAWNMSEPHRWKEHLHAPAGDRFLLILTLVLTVVSDLTVAIAVGSALGLAMRLMQRGAAPEEWTPPDR
ncbi:MAG TPA: SulP family inorganic anion transporter [Sphingobium sp.]|nr:SulP family inorganic anion transporter [Sphingobium sp.]